MDEKQLQAMYAAMNGKMELGDYNSFKNQLGSDGTFRKAFYDEASKSLELPDYGSFDSGFKKKEPTASQPVTSTPPAAGPSSTSAEPNPVVTPQPSLMDNLHKADPYGNNTPFNSFYKPQPADATSTIMPQSNEKLYTARQEQDRKQVEDIIKNPQTEQYQPSAGQKQLDQGGSFSRDKSSFLERAVPDKQQRDIFTQRFYSGQIGADEIALLRKSNPLVFAQEFGNITDDQLASQVNNKTKNLRDYANSTRFLDAASYQGERDRLQADTDDLYRVKDALQNVGNYVYKGPEGKYKTDIADYQPLVDRLNSVGDIDKAIANNGEKSAFLQNNFETKVYKPREQQLVQEFIKRQETTLGQSIDEIYKEAKANGGVYRGVQLLSPNGLLSDEGTEYLNRSGRNFLTEKDDPIVYTHENGSATNWFSDKVPYSTPDFTKALRNYMNYEVPARVAVQDKIAELRKADPNLDKYLSVQDGLNSFFSTDGFKQQEAYLKSSTDTAMASINNKYQGMLGSNPAYQAIINKWNDKVNKGLTTASIAQSNIHTEVNADPTFQAMLQQRQGEVDAARTKANTLREQFIVNGLNQLGGKAAITTDGHMVVNGVDMNVFNEKAAGYEDAINNARTDALNKQREAVGEKADVENIARTLTPGGAAAGGLMSGLKSTMDNMGASMSEWVLHKTGIGADSYDYFDAQESANPVNVGKYAEQNFKFNGLKSLLNPSFYTFQTGQMLPYVAPAIAAGLATGGTGAGMVLSGGFEAFANSARSYRNLVENGVNANGTKLTTQEAGEAAANQFQKEVLPDILLQYVEAGTVLKASKTAAPVINARTVARGAGQIALTGAEGVAKAGIQMGIAHNEEQAAKGEQTDNFFDYMQTPEFANNAIGGLVGGLVLGAALKPKGYVESVRNWKTMINEGGQELASGAAYSKALQSEVQGRGSEFRDAMRLLQANATDPEVQASAGQALQYSTHLAANVAKAGVHPGDITGIYTAHNLALADMFTNLAQVDEGKTALSRGYANRAKEYFQAAEDASKGQAKIYYVQQQDGAPVFISEPRIKALASSGTLESWYRRGTIDGVRAVGDDQFSSQMDQQLAGVNRGEVDQAPGTQDVTRQRETDAVQRLQDNYATLTPAMQKLVDTDPQGLLRNIAAQATTPEGRTQMESQVGKEVVDAATGLHGQSLREQRVADLLQANREQIPNIYHPLIDNSPALLAREIADQAQGRMANDALHEVGDARAAAERVYGKDVVDAAVEAFPLRDESAGEAAHLERTVPGERTVQTGDRLLPRAQEAHDQPVTVTAVHPDRVEVAYDDGSTDQFTHDELTSTFQPQDTRSNNLVAPTSVNLSLISPHIPRYADLHNQYVAAAQAGDETSMARIREDVRGDLQARIQKLLPDATVTVNNAHGAWDGGFEKSFRVDLPTLNDDAVHAMTKIAQDFGQEAVHFLRDGVEDAQLNRPLGEPDEAGTVLTPVIKYTLAKPVSVEEFQQAIRASDLRGGQLSDDGRTITIYNAYNGNDTQSRVSASEATDRWEERASTFTSSLQPHGPASAEITVGEFRSYGRDTNTAIHTYDELERHVSTSDAYQSRLRAAAPDTGSDWARRFLNPAQQHLIDRISRLTVRRADKAELQTRIAGDYDKMRPNALDVPVVKDAYQALAKTMGLQYERLPIRVYAHADPVMRPDGQLEWQARTTEPYGSSQEMTNDIDKNNRMVFYTTQAGFGTEGVDYTGHPLLEPSRFTSVPVEVRDEAGHVMHNPDGSIMREGYPMKVNDLFRVVHDYIAHATTGAQFGVRGEEKAWMAHAATILEEPGLSRQEKFDALWALTSETRGQNSWVNYNGINEATNKNYEQVARLRRAGLHDEADALKAQAAPIVFADQKADLLPARDMLSGVPEVDQFVTQYARENKINMDDQPSEAVTRQSLSDRIRSAADRVEAAGKGLTLSAAIPIPPKMMADVMRLVADALDKGSQAIDAVSRGIQYVRDNLKQPFDENVLRDYLNKHIETSTQNLPPTKEATETQAQFVRRLNEYKRGQTLRNNAVQANKDIIDFSKREPEFTGNPAKDRKVIEGVRNSLILHAKNIIKSIPKKFQDPDLQEHVYHHMEDPSVPLTFDEQQFRDQYVKPLAEAVTNVYKKLSAANPDYVAGMENTFMTEIGYVPREVKGKGGTIERLASGGLSGLGSRLKGTSTHLNQRVYHTLTDENGVRRVVAIKGGQVLEHDAQGNPTVLGEYKGMQSLKDNIDLRDEAIRRSGIDKSIGDLRDEVKTLTRSKDKFDSVNRQIDDVKKQLTDLDDVRKGKAELDRTLQKQSDLQKELAILTSSKAREEASGSRIATVKDQLAHLGDLQKELEDLQNVDKRRQGLEGELDKLHSQRSLLQGDVNRIGELQDKVQHLQDIKDTAKDMHAGLERYNNLDTERGQVKDAMQKIQFDKNGAPERARLSTRLKEIDNEMQAIKDKQDKFFIDKAGNLHTLGAATVKEIESQTGTQYYKTPLANFMNAFIQLKQVDMANGFLNKLKSTMAEQDLIHDLKKGPPPDGYATTAIPNFRGYAFPVKIAAELDRLSSANKVDPLRGLTVVNQFLRNSIVFGVGIKHWANEINLWLKEGGVSRFAHPVRLAKTGMQAVRALVTQSPEYFRVMERGGSLMMHDTRNYTQLILSAANEQLKGDKTTAQKISDALGYANPLKLMKMLGDLSHKSAMGSHDLLMMQAVFEHMDKGNTLDQSIDYVNKYIPDYDIPSTILGSKAASDLVRSPNLLMFSAYHYGVIRSYGNMIKDLTTGIGKGDAKQIAGAADKIAMAALLSTLVYPVLDKVAQGIFGSDAKGKKSRVRRAGSSKLEEDVYQLATGQKALSQFIYAYATPAAGTELMAELATDKSLNPNSNLTPYVPSDVSAHPVRAVKDVAGFAASKFGPYQQYEQASTNISSPAAVGEGQLDIIHGTSEAKREYNLIRYEQNAVNDKIFKLKSEGKLQEAQKVYDDYLNDLSAAKDKMVREDGPNTAPMDPAAQHVGPHLIDINAPRPVVIRGKKVMPTPEQWDVYHKEYDARMQALQGSRMAPAAKASLASDYAKRQMFSQFGNLLMKQEVK